MLIKKITFLTTILLLTLSLPACNGLAAPTPAASSGSEGQAIDVVTFTEEAATAPIEPAATPVAEVETQAVSLNAPAETPVVSPTQEPTVPDTPAVSPVISAEPASLTTELVAIPQNEMNIRQGPSTDYPVIGSAAVGESFNIVGRNEETTWVQVSSEAISEGWLFADLVEITGDVDAAPVIEAAPPPPTPVPPIEAVVQPETTGPAVILFAESSHPDDADEERREKGFFTINPDGTGLAHINSLAPDGRIEMSPDGRKIAFVVQQWFPGGPLGTYSDDDLYVMNTDGAGLVGLAVSPDFGVASPRWSPDGQRLAYTQSKHDLSRGLPGSDFFNDIYIVDADGSNKINVTNSPPGQEITNHQWSPDGQQFVVVTRSLLEEGFSAPYDIQVMNVDGSHWVNLTEDLAGSAESPQWSADGQQITFRTFSRLIEAPEQGYTVVPNDPESGRYIVNKDGSNRTHLPDDNIEYAIPDYYPLRNLSRNGYRLPGSDRVIILGSPKDGGPILSHTNLYNTLFAIDLDGSNITQLTPKDMAVHHSAWRVSPDGQTIAFAAMATRDGQYPSGNYAIYTIKVDGSQLTQLTGHDYKYIDYVGWASQ